MNYKNNKRKYYIIIAVLLALLAGRGIIFSPLSSISFSSAVYDRNGKLLRFSLSADEKYRVYSGVRRVSPLLRQSILHREDRYFYFHPGINPWALGKAIHSTFISGERRRGASTITMQLARMLYRIETKSVPGKAFQILAALWLELSYSKNQIFEAYLNLAPFGGNIEGVEAASLVYFQKKSIELNPSEVSRLSAVPQHPAKRSTELTRNELPFLAPHFTRRMLEMYPGREHIITSLDMEMQRLVERQTALHIEGRGRDGINNAAALLIDYRNMQILASLGSVDFFNEGIQGQVDGTRSYRSPGSALKPFIYALGLDQGIIHSESLLKDTPMNFGPYSPENFEGDFLGPVHAAEALIRSRNIPAVQIASRLHNPDLFEFLKSAGIERMRSRDEYGLSIVLGSLELTMEDMARLYAMLANRGLLRSLKTDTTPGTDMSFSLLSPQAAFIMEEMLAQNPSVDGLKVGDFIRRKIRIKWKTGTSAAFRDAWAAAIFGRFVLVVWVGNFDGSGNPSFVGREAAAPLLFRIVDAVAASSAFEDEATEEIPAGVEKVDVCAVSGALPGRFCPAKRSAWFIPGRSPIEKCAVHRELLVLPGPYRACASHMNFARPEVFEFWPTDILRIFQKAGMIRRIPPPFHPDCNMDEETAGFPPAITSPVSGVEYSVRSVGDESIAFSATADGGVRRIFWFVNDTLAGSSPVDSPFFWPAKPGNFSVRVVDDRGLSDTRDMHVTVTQ